MDFNSYWTLIGGDTNYADRKAAAETALDVAAKKNEIPIIRVKYCLRWYYQEAVRRKKYDFLIKFPPEQEHIVHL